MSKECKVRLQRGSSPEDQYAQPDESVRFQGKTGEVLYVKAHKVQGAQEIDVTITPAETLREEQIRRIVCARSFGRGPGVHCAFTDMVNWVLQLGEQIAAERAAREQG